MTQSFWETIANIPWWIYALFIYFVHVGIVATKPSTLSLRNLYALPLIFILFSFLLMCNLNFNLYNFFVWCGAIVLGTFIGYMQFYLLKVKAIRGENKILIPGTRTLLLLPIIFCCAQFYMNSTDPTLLLDDQFSVWLYLFYGFCLGFCLGRLLYSKTMAFT